MDVVFEDSESEGAFFWDRDGACGLGRGSGMGDILQLKSIC